MRTRLTFGLVLAIATGALLVAPASSAGRGVEVRENRPDINALCVAGAGGVDGIETISTVRSRWVLKQDGRSSKLFCRFKGADVDLGGSRALRLLGGDAKGLCPFNIGVLLRARFKMNARGNGFLKCAYAPTA